MEVLNRKCGNVKGALTRFSNYLETLSPDFDVEDLKSQLRKAETLLDTFDNIQIEIELLPSETGTLDDTVIDQDALNEAREVEVNNQHFTERKTFEDTYYQAISKAKNILKNLTNESVTSNIRNEVITNVGTGRSNVSLPKIQLPTFDGAIGNWLKFRDTFTSLIHSSTTLTNIKKFHYLNSSVTGDAARTIEALGISDTNYVIAWNTLLERYEDSNELLYYHTNGLFELPIITRESHSELRQFLDNAKNHLLTLKTLGKKTENWDILLVCLLTSKLNKNLKKEWEKSLIELKEKPLVKDLFSVLEDQYKLLQKLIENKTNSSDSQAKKFAQLRTDTKPKSIKSYATITKKGVCSMCKGEHAIHACTEFKNLSPTLRVQKIKELGLCFNCLSDGHRNKDCTFGPCRKCGKKHNNLLHIDKDAFTPATQKKEDCVIQSLNAHKTSCSSVSAQGNAAYTLIPTAKIYVLDRLGQRHECRALLDTGAQPHIITRNLCKRLGLAKRRQNIELSGIEQGTMAVPWCTTVKILSRTTSYSAVITCIILDKITDDVPSRSVQASKIQIPSDVELADPEYDCEGPVELLIGASLFFKLLSIGQIFLNNSDLVLQKTILGWIIAGDVILSSRRMTCNIITNKMLDERLKRFWEVEHPYSETSTATQRKPEFIETHFVDNIQRDHEGRFVVSIPFKDNVNELGNSEESAKSRLISLERRLAKNPNLKKQYHMFMEEYETLGHMTEIDPTNSTNNLNFYLPHHAVFKDQSTTTKLRVVFDGSARTSSGLSLNDVQHTGPTIQDEIFSILLRFRKHQFVLAADIAKMYRQVQVKEEHRCIQRILWRTDASLPFKHYKLNTITYGTASAPFLATRCLKELSRIYQEQDPTTCEVIANDFYVDDLLTGAESREELIQIKCNLSNILNTAGFELRKWACNDARLNTTSNADNPNTIKITDDRDPKTLGILWNARTDTLTYCVNYDDTRRITKRTITSAIAQIFDPLGLIGPSIIQAKIILQQLWQLKVNWDKSLPQEIHSQWQKISKDLVNINNFIIPRTVIDKSAKKLEYHVFCDASERAYGACIYVSSEDMHKKRIVQLLCAKSRVAPLMAMTLLRLELLGALLLAQLSDKVERAFKTKKDDWIYWSDSTVTLAWIKTPSSRWKTFIANRTAEIQELTTDNWNHVESNMNPADLISREVSTTELSISSMWWFEPTWLTQVKTQWPVSQLISPTTELEEKRSRSNLLNACTIVKNDKNAISDDDDNIIKKYSAFPKLKRIVAYILKFITNCKNKTQEKKSTRTPLHENKTTLLKSADLDAAEICLMKLAQAGSFSQEIKTLKEGKIMKNGALVQLHPFLDTHGLLRVGGRLENAIVSYEQKHPIILPTKHELTQLIMKYEHERSLNAGCQAIIASLRTRY